MIVRALRHSLAMTLYGVAGALFPALLAAGFAYANDSLPVGLLGVGLVLKMLTMASAMGAVFCAMGAVFHATRKPKP